MDNLAPHTALQRSCGDPNTRFDRAVGIRDHTLLHRSMAVARILRHRDMPADLGCRKPAVEQLGCCYWREVVDD